MIFKKILFSSKQRRMLGIGQIYFIRAEGQEPIFLEVMKNDSIDVLREIFQDNFSDEQKEKYKEFWEIIHENYLKSCEKTRKANKKKKKYYEEMAIKSRKNKIKKLQEEIERLRGQK